MPKIIVAVDNFHLSSHFACATTETINADGGKSYNYYTHQSPSVADITKSFYYSLPTGSEIKSMTLHATISTTTYGASILTINGVSCSSGSVVQIPIDIYEFGLEDTVDVEFIYRSMMPSHQHAPSGAPDTTSTVGNSTVNGYYTNHQGVVSYSDVYLEIEYMCGAYLYHCENGNLVPYQLYCAENGALVPYQLFNAVNGNLVQY